MTVDSRRPLGIPQGLNLGSDPAQTSGLTVADSLRYDETGALVGRLGRKRMELSFPAEGFGTAVPEETIDHLVSPAGGVRGYLPFYSQRLSTVPSETLLNPQLYTDTEGPVTSVGWAITGDFIAILELGGRARYSTGGGGGSGTLSQVVADFRTPFSPSADYTLDYSVSRLSGTASITLSGFSAAPVLLPLATGTYRIDIVSAAAAADVVITVVSAGSANIFIEQVSLKRKEVLGADNIPGRLNIVHKGSNGKLYLNRHEHNGADGILSGSGAFESPSTRAKFVSYGKNIYVIDESSRPMLLREKPASEQSYLGRTLYDFSPASIRWPIPSTPRPALTTVTGGLYQLPFGDYRFRVSFEDALGRFSAPSMPTLAHLVLGPTPPGQVTHILIEYDHMLGDAELANVTYATVWYQYQASSTVEIEPTSYIKLRRIPIGKNDNVADTINSARIGIDDVQGKATSETLSVSSGHMPKLLDFVIVNDVGYGIASNDVIYREVFTGPLPRVHDPSFFRSGNYKSYDTTEIKTIPVNPSYLMVSEPGEPHRMERHFPIARGSEVGVGLSTVGDIVFVHTNVGIHAFSDDPPTFKRIPTSVGLLARDSVQEDERMIRFMGSDGVPRLFNGATVDETATELLPLFDQEDYSGFYQKFDRQYAKQVSSASGKRRYYLNFPTTAGSSNVSSKSSPEGSTSNNLAIADLTRGRALWSVDRTPYEQIAWLGRESRISAVNNQGEFYFLEEGFADEGPVEAPSTNPAITGAVRWFGQQGFTTRFFIVSIEADTVGQDMTLRCRVDGISDLTETFTVNTTGRRRVDFGLPGWFKGLYLDVQFSGFTTTSGRPRVYDLKVEQEVLGGL